MKPCDCHDMYTCLNKLNEQGIQHNNYCLSLQPSSVWIETSDCKLRLPQSIFKKFAKWYLEDQIKEKS